MGINKNISKRNENVNTKNKEGAIFAKKIYYAQHIFG
jgi:hypothetical protein